MRIKILDFCLPIVNPTFGNKLYRYLYMRNAMYNDMYVYRYTRRSRDLGRVYHGTGDLNRRFEAVDICNFR